MYNWLQVSVSADGGQITQDNWIPKGVCACLLLVIWMYIWRMWWKSFCKHTKSEALEERCHVENSWDATPALTKKKKKKISYVQRVCVVRGYSWLIQSDELVHSRKRILTPTLALEVLCIESSRLVITQSKIPSLQIKVLNFKLPALLMQTFKSQCRFSVFSMFMFFRDFDQILPCRIRQLG